MRARIHGDFWIEAASDLEARMGNNSAMILDFGDGVLVYVYGPLARTEVADAINRAMAEVTAPSLIAAE